jgi:hypothetical protein
MGDNHVNVFKSAGVFVAMVRPVISDGRAGEARPS